MVRRRRYAVVLFVNFVTTNQQPPHREIAQRLLFVLDTIRKAGRGLPSLSHW